MAREIFSLFSVQHIYKQLVCVENASTAMSQLFVAVASHLQWGRAVFLGAQDRADLQLLVGAGGRPGRASRTANGRGRYRLVLGAASGRLAGRWADRMLHRRIEESDSGRVVAPEPDFIEGGHRSGAYGVLKEQSGLKT
ncbi:hypothetical protein ACLOJK_010630 [Asimina triloba]